MSLEAEARDAREGKLDRRQLLRTLLTAGAAAVAASAVPATAMAVDGEVVRVGYVADSSSTLPTITARNVLGGMALDVYASKHDGIRVATDAASKSAVFANASAGYGIYATGKAAGLRGAAFDSSGVGVLAVAASPGTALKVAGRAKFERSGVATIAAGKNLVVVTVPGGVTSSSKYLVTPQGSPGAGVYVQYAGQYSSYTFRIVLNKPAAVACKFAWMVLD